MSRQEVSTSMFLNLCYLNREPRGGTHNEKPQRLPYLLLGERVTYNLKDSVFQAKKSLLAKLHRTHQSAQLELLQAMHFYY